MDWSWKPQQSFAKTAIQWTPEGKKRLTKGELSKRKCAICSTVQRLAADHEIWREYVAALQDATVCTGHWLLS